MIMGVWSHALCEEGLESYYHCGRGREREGEGGRGGGGREGGEAVYQKVEEVGIAEEGRGFVEGREDGGTVSNEGEPCGYVMVP